MPHVFLDSFRRAGEAQSARVSEAPAGPWFGLCGHCPAITLRLESALDTTSSRCRRAFFTALALIDYTGRNFGQAVFCNNPFTGLLVLVGLIISNPDIAISGLAASTISLLVAMILRQPRSSLSTGMLGFNAVLLGIVLPVVLEPPHAWYWPLICITAALSVVLTSSLGQALGSLRPSLPVIALPFNLLGVLYAFALTTTSPHVQYEAVPNPTNTTRISDSPIDYALVLQGGVLGVGQVLAVQDWWCSGLVLLGMLIYSPFLTAAALFGSLLTTCFSTLADPGLREAAYTGLHGYNGMLASCAISFFFVPTWRSAFVALAAISLTAVFQLILESPMRESGIPLLSLPFVISTLLVVGASSEGLPRPILLSYPELHRALWLRARREERSDTRHSVSLGMQASSTLQMSSMTSVALGSALSSRVRSSSSPQHDLDISCTPVYRQIDSGASVTFDNASIAARSISPQRDPNSLDVPVSPVYRKTDSSASVAFDTASAVERGNSPAQEESSNTDISSTQFYHQRY